MSRFIKLTGLWLTKDGGETFATGNLGFADVVLFKNNKRPGSKDPDFNLCVVKKERSGESNRSEPPPSDGGDDGIPF